MKPVTIDDIIENLTELKAKYGNLEVRRYERRYTSEPGIDTYPKFCTMPTDKEGKHIVVIL